MARRVFLLMSALLLPVVAFAQPVDWTEMDSLFVVRAPSLEHPEVAPDSMLVTASSDPMMIFMPGSVLMEEGLPATWEKLIAFRERHPAIESGVYERLDGVDFGFYRGLRLDRSHTDEVLVVRTPPGQTRLNVSAFFQDDTVLREALSGEIGLVSFGQVNFTAGDSELLLIEVMQ